MNINVLDRNFQITYVLSGCSSIIWNKKCYEAGDFEIYLPFKSELLDNIMIGSYLIRDVDVHSDDKEGYIYYTPMIVTGLEVTTNIETGTNLIITGKDLRYILKRRIIFGQFTMRGYNPYDTVTTLIYRQVSNSFYPERVIDQIECGKVTKVYYPDGTIVDVDYLKSDSYKCNIQRQGDNLYDVVVEICKNYHLGWNVKANPSTGKIRIYFGDEMDRRVDNEYNSTPIVFAHNLGNIAESTYKVSDDNYYNVALVTGEGDGVNKKFGAIGQNGVSGLDRREILVDGSNISTNKGSEDGSIDGDEYRLLLESVGAEKLNTTVISGVYDAQVIDGIQYTFGKDYFVGDICTIYNELGESIDVQITSAIASEDENGKSVIPTFEKYTDEILEINDDMDDSESASPVTTLQTMVQYSPAGYITSSQGWYYFNIDTLKGYPISEGGSADVKVENGKITSSGQTTITLKETPTKLLQVSINGLQVDDAKYSISSSVITFNFTLGKGSEYSIQYT